MSHTNTWIRSGRPAGRAVLHLLAGVFLLGAAAGAAAQTAPAAAPVLPAGYVGTSRCRDCHSNHSHSFDISAHADDQAMLAAAKKAGQPPVAGCETCHGPGKAHADAMENAAGDETETLAALKTSPIYAFHAGDSAEQKSKFCLECHSTGTEQMSFAHSEHMDHNVACVNCHAVHGNTENALSKPQPQLCYGCHQQQEAQFNLPFAHPVKQGVVQCADCHNPHGTLVPTQLRSAAAQDQVCYTCHQDKQGPFIYQHEPTATEGCTDCHTPHGSANPDLLKVANVNQLCLSCHTAASFSAAPGTPSFHNQAAQFQACTLCHPQVHGSNLDPAFTR